jgi:uncharacterized protein YjbI with pentapeptide repeats
MIAPQPAPVKPRIVSTDGAELLLEDEIQRHIDRGDRGLVAIFGPHGSGKSAALQHLASLLPIASGVLFLESDEAISADLPLLSWSHRLVIHTAKSAQEFDHLARYHLAPWNRDDLIEYLLARHRDRCTSVMERIGSDEPELFDGLPELWAVILEQLAADESIPDVRSALRQYLEQQLPDTDVVQRSRNACLNLLTVPAQLKEQEPHLFSPPGFTPSLARILRHLAVQYLLAAERIVADLRDGCACDFLACHLPRELVRSIAKLAPLDDRVQERLHNFLVGPDWSHAMAASILHAIEPTWRPESLTRKRLRGAYLGNVSWPGIQLSKSNLGEADMSVGDLTGANLRGTWAGKARFSGSCLKGADLTRLNAPDANLVRVDMSNAFGDKIEFAGADFTGAKLVNVNFTRTSFRGANLTSADFAGASLHEADFEGAELGGTDFSGANLEYSILVQLKFPECIVFGARFTGAILRECDLEYLDFGQADFRSANLRKSLLTGTTIMNASLEGARLNETGLGEINWENCCLRHADLRGATFHMGSSRSGLLFTPIASEGTRTGFYTDAYDDRSYKEPEEIRKANLCGCDLRGARIDKVDFYLVDLRGAQYDANKEQYFRRCGAILGAWC